VTSTTNSLTKYSNYDSHGNFGTVQNWVSGSTFLTKTYTYYTTGLVNLFTDVNSAQTQYTYGDCNSSFLTNISEPLSLAESFTWDCNGEVETSFTDESGNTTQYGYVDQSSNPDPLWRQRSITDPLNNATWTIYSPGGSLPVTIETLLPFNNGLSATDVLTTFDGLDRPYLKQTRQAPGGTQFDTVVSAYDALGRPDSVGQPCGSVASTPCTSAVTTTAYDALNRPTQIVDGGGETLSYSYPENDVLQTVGPTQTFSKQLEYDALGRLTSVCEITAGTTSYPGKSCSLQANP
jgi:YD repeat-containing protein